MITNGTVLERAKLQSDIAQWVRQKTGSAVTVNCPQDPSMSPGSKWDCLLTAPDGSTAVADVTVQDRQGDVIWQVQQ